MLGSDTVLLIQALNKYPDLFKRLSENTDISAQTIIAKMKEDFVGLSEAIDALPLIDLQLFAAQKDIQLSSEQKAIDKLLNNVRIINHQELAPVSQEKVGIYQALREQAAENALNAVGNYLDKNVQNISGKLLTSVLKNALALLENVKQPLKLDAVQKLIKTFEKIEQQTNLTDEQKKMVEDSLKQCHPVNQTNLKNQRQVVLMER